MGSFTYPSRERDREGHWGREKRQRERGKEIEREIDNRRETLGDK